VFEQVKIISRIFYKTLNLESKATLSLRGKLNKSKASQNSKEAEKSKNDRARSTVKNSKTSKKGTPLKESRTKSKRLSKIKITNIFSYITNFC
jgi:hypothetical protein